MTERNRSNVLMYKVARLYCELSTAEAFLKDLKGTLEGMNEESNLKWKIGVPFISKMPKFKIMEKDADAVKQRLRKLCSGEIQIQEALEETEKLLEFVKEAKEVFNNTLLNPYILEISLT